MKIAFFTDCFLDLTGGIVTSIAGQKKALESRGHTVYIFSSSYPKSKAEKQKLKKDHIFPVKSCRIFGRGLTPIARRPQIIEEELLLHYPEIKDFDVFYVHYEAGCSIAGLRLGKELGIKTIQVMHGREDIGEQNLVPKGFKTIVAVLLNWFHSWYLPHPVKVKKDNHLIDSIAGAKMWSLMINHANAADLVLTPSEHFQKKLIKYGVKRDVKVLPNGVADEFFISELQPKKLIPGDPLKIIWHSRVSQEKRIMPFLEALTLVKGNYHLNVYGDGNDLKKAKKYTSAHHLNVTFRGSAPFSKIYPEIVKSHLDILNSYNFDTFGMTLIEAESAGTPVLFVDPNLQETVPINGSILVHSKTSSAPSPDEVANAIDSLINHPDKIEQMSCSMLSQRDSVRVSRIIEILEKYITALTK